MTREIEAMDLNWLDGSYASILRRAAVAVEALEADPLAAAEFDMRTAILSIHGFRSRFRSPEARSAFAPIGAICERLAQSFKLEIERLKLQLEKARRARFGQSSERGRQIVEQLELAIADLEETQAEVEAKAVIEAAAMPSRAPSSSGTRKPARRPLAAPMEGRRACARDHDLS